MTCLEREAFNLFRKKILIGTSVDIVKAIIEHLEESNIPFEIGFKDILKRSSERFRSKKNDEVYELVYTIEVRKKYAKQVEAIVSQYVSQEDVKQSYKVAKKKSRKLEKKENALFLFKSFIFIILIQVIETGKNFGADIISYIACALLLMLGVFMTIKYFKEMKKEQHVLRKINMILMFLGIYLMFYTVASFLRLLLT